MEVNELPLCPSDFSCGSNIQGFIGPFASTELEIIWAPKSITSINNETNLIETEQFLINFNTNEDLDNENIKIDKLKPIRIKVQGYPKELPIWLSVSTLMMQICWYDRLYQDCFAVNNRTSSAVKVTFSIPKEIADHVAVFPKTGFVQLS